MKAKYNDRQREAIALAREGGMTAPAVARAAAAGELLLNGRALEPFEIPPASCRDIALKWRRRVNRAGMQTELADRPHRDAVEVLRKALISVAQVELRRMQKRHRKAGAVEWREIRELARTVADLSRLPGPLDPPPAGVNRPDAPTGLRGVESRGGQAGRLLRAHRGGLPPDRLAAQTPSPVESPPPADYEPKPVDEEPVVVDPGAVTAESLREEIERASARNGDPDRYGA